MEQVRQLTSGSHRQRSAIQPTVSVVSARSRAASLTFKGWPLRQLQKGTGPFRFDPPGMRAQVFFNKVQLAAWFQRYGVSNRAMPSRRRTGSERSSISCSVTR